MVAGGRDMSPTPREPAAARRTRPDPTGPPPGGMLWEFSGELRSLMSLPAALALQVAHPAVGAGVDEHSVFRTDPWGRAERSLRSLLLWVYGGSDGAAEGRRLRELHREIRGTDTAGRPYHALDPGLYGWVHATGYPVMLRARELLYDRPCTSKEAETLFREWRSVGLLLGLRERDLPGTPAEFAPRYQEWLRELEPTPVLGEITDPTRTVAPPDRGPLLLRLPLRLAWPLLRGPAARLQAFLAVGLMPPEARKAVGLSWSPAQERRLVTLGRRTAAVVPRLPERLRYLPAAARARRAARR